MSHVRVLSMISLLMCALGAASAQAALPEFSGTLPVGGKTTSTGPQFEDTTSKLIIKCTGSEGTVEVLTVKEAVFDELCLGAEAELSKTKLGKCTGSNDTIAGSILAKGKGTLGYALGTLTPLVALTVSPEVKIKCALGAEVVVRGCVLGAVTLAKGLVQTVKIEGAAGVQKYTDYTSDTGVAVGCKLESSLNGAAFSAADLVATITVTFSKEVSVLD
jgi:hypothetical protein